MEPSKNTYQPPKLKIKSKWVPSNENSYSNLQIEDYEKQSRKSTHSIALSDCDNFNPSPHIKKAESKAKAAKLKASKKAKPSLNKNTLGPSQAMSHEFDSPNPLYDETVEDNRVPCDN